MIVLVVQLNPCRLEARGSMLACLLVFLGT